VSEARERMMDDGRWTMKTAIHGQSSIVNRRNVLDDPLAPTVQLDLNLPARIPEDYVPDASFAAPALSSSGGLNSG